MLFLVFFWIIFVAPILFLAQPALAGLSQPGFFSTLFQEITRKKISPLICFNSLKQLGAAVPVLSFFDVILKQNHEKKLTAAFFFLIINR